MARSGIYDLDSQKNCMTLNIVNGKNLPLKLIVSERKYLFMYMGFKVTLINC